MSDFVTPWIVARQAPLSTGFSRHEYWSGLPCPSPGDLPDQGIEPESILSPTLQVDSLLSEPLGKSMNTGVGSLSLLQGIFPTQGIEPISLMSPALADRFFTTRVTWEAPRVSVIMIKKVKSIIS